MSKRAKVGLILELYALVAIVLLLLSHHFELRVPKPLFLAVLITGFIAAPIGGYISIKDAAAQMQRKNRERSKRSPSPWDPLS